MLGYITRSKGADRAFFSLGGYGVVPDEMNKKLIITEAVMCDGDEKFFICHKCDDLTSFKNAKHVDITEMKDRACVHSKLSSVLFGRMEIKNLDKTRNVIDLVKDDKETIAIVFPCTRVT